jgi:lysylphosphatidylglycerol synthetase-like protein (DUF2156 family)
MERQLNIKEIARKAYSPLHSDGIEDMMAGVLFFNFGAILNSQHPFAPYVVAFLPLIAWFARKFVTYPRVGYMKPSERNPSSRVGMAVMLVSGLAAVVLLALLLIMSHYPDSVAIQLWPVKLMHTALAVLLVVMLAGMGIYSGMQRWYVYAALTATFAVLAGFLRGWTPVDGVAAFSVFIVVWGLVMITNFVRKYPVREKEAAEDSAVGDAK